MDGMRIGELSRAGGVSVETVRYYQRRGLLGVPDRGIEGGIRRYGPNDVRKLRFIRSAQAAGFTLDEIAALVEMDTVADRNPARALALRRIQALDLKIAELTEARNGLVRLAARCGDQTGGACPILSAFEPD